MKKFFILLALATTIASCYNSEWHSATIVSKDYVPEHSVLHTNKNVRSGIYYYIPSYANVVDVDTIPEKWSITYDVYNSKSDIHYKKEVTITKDCYEAISVGDSIEAKVYFGSSRMTEPDKYILSDEIKVPYNSIKTQYE